MSNCIRCRAQGGGAGGGGAPRGRHLHVHADDPPVARRTPPAHRHRTPGHCMTRAHPHDALHPAEQLETRTGLLPVHQIRKTGLHYIHHSFLPKDPIIILSNIRKCVSTLSKTNQMRKCGLTVLSTNASACVLYLQVEHFSSAPTQNTPLMANNLREVQHFIFRIFVPEISNYSQNECH